MMPQLVRGRMIETWQLAGFWGPRDESAESCAERWLTFFRDLEALGSDLLRGWGPRADSLSAAMKELVLEHEVLSNEVRAGAMERLDENAPGFIFGAWNRREGVDGVAFSAICGQGSSVLLNNAHLRVHTGSAADRATWALLASDMLRLLVEAWDPDWGFYVAGSLRNQQSEKSDRSPVAGYLTYLSSGRRAVLPSNVSGKVTVTPEGGVLVSLIEPDGNLRKPKDVLRLEKTLTKSGCFAPTPTDRPTLGSQPGGASGPGFQTNVSEMTKKAPSLIELNLKHDPIPENAHAFAADIAAAALKITGVELDYSRESLRTVDAVLEHLRSDGPPVDQFRETLFGFGCYVGEVMVRHANGRWDIPRSIEEKTFLGCPLLVRFPDGRCANPILKVMRCYEEGEEHNLAFFYDVMVGRRAR